MSFLKKHKIKFFIAFIFCLIYLYTYYSKNFKSKCIIDWDELKGILIGIVMLVGQIAFFTWCLKHIIHTFKIVKIPILLFIICWSMKVNRYFINDYFFYDNHNKFFIFDESFYVSLVGGMICINITTWILMKFVKSLELHHLKASLKDTKKLKEEIEQIVSRCDNQQNCQLNKLYELLQVNSLSLRTQQKIIRSNFIKNFFVSLFFFILGIIIPKIIIAFFLT